MSPKNVDQEKFSNTTIVYGFDDFALFITSINRMQQDFELPSISTSNPA